MMINELVRGKMSLLAGALTRDIRGFGGFQDVHLLGTSKTMK